MGGQCVGRLIVSITLPSEVRAEKKTFERTGVDEACAEWVAEVCWEEGLGPEECERLIYSECPMVVKTETGYVATIEGTGLVSKEGVFPLRGLSKLTYTWRVEGEEARKPEASLMTNPYPELDVPFKVVLTCFWEEKPRFYYDLTLVFSAVLSGLASDAWGEARATTRVRFSRR
jgi:hypothetical protein